MALLDLSLVTRSLNNLLTESFNVSDAWSGLAPTISPQRSDTMSSDGLGLYLYHLSEDAHFKNVPAPGTDMPPIRYAPMALSLYYLLTAHSTSDDAYLEQQMMGIAVKAFHDYPVIDDSTQINGTPVFLPPPAGLQGTNNRLRILLQPILPNDASSIWTAGTSPLQLSAYYEVSVVLLEPEVTQSRAGRVLAYGVHTFIEGAPRIDSSENTLSFTIPGDPDVREVILRPAQVPVGGRVTFIGSGFGGDSTSLLLNNARWTAPVAVDVAWGVAATSNRLSAIVQETASGQVVLPGIYSAQVRGTRRRTLPDGTIRDFEHISNACPFTITPRIDNISAPDVNDVVTVQGYIFAHADLAADALQVYLGEDRLIRGTAGSLNPSEFAVDTAPSPPTLELRLPAGLASGQVVPLRIFVNGAESPPNWIVIP